MSFENQSYEAESIKKRYELILTSIGEGVYGLDKDGKATFVNPAAETMTGWLEEDLLGKVIHDFHHHTHTDGSHYPKEECSVYQTVRDGKQREVDDEVFWRKDGSSFPVEYISTAIKFDDEIVGAVIVFKDISERKRSERELKAALAQVEKLKEQLQAENHYLMQNSMGIWIFLLLTLATVIYPLSKKLKDNKEPYARMIKPIFTMIPKKCPSLKYSSRRYIQIYI